MERFKMHLYSEALSCYSQDAYVESVFKVASCPSKCAFCFFFVYCVRYFACVGRYTVGVDSGGGSRVWACGYSFA